MQCVEWLMISSVSFNTIQYDRQTDRQWNEVLHQYHALHRPAHSRHHFADITATGHM